VLRVAAPPPPAWDALLPPEVRRLPDELARIDAYLDDERFITPGGHCSPPGWAARRSPCRPCCDCCTSSTATSSATRRDAARPPTRSPGGGSATSHWMRPCRTRPPWPELVGRAGPTTIEQLNHALLAKLAGERVLRCRKLRIDTTVVEADIAHPTDADLLEHAVRTLGGLVRRIHARGAATHTPFRDRSRAAGRRLKQISRTLRRRTGRAPAEIDRLTAQVAQIARRTLAQAVRVARNARRALGRRPADGRLRRLVARLEEATAQTNRLLEQTRQRLRGNRVIPDRLISLADPDARPIRKGKPHKPTEFGYTLLLAEDERGLSPTISFPRATRPTPHNYSRPCVEWPRCGAGRRALWSPTAASGWPPPTAPPPSSASGGALPARRQPHPARRRGAYHDRRGPSPRRRGRHPALLSQGPQRPLTAPPRHRPASHRACWGARLH
jgi:transposase, IS5 family